MATKGWSFGALTDALKSAAFLDAGQDAGQVALIAANNRIQVNGIANTYTGLRAIGVEQNDVTLYSSGTRTAKGIVGSMKANWYTNNFEIGLSRGAGTDSLGYAMLYNGARKYQFLPSGKHSFDGDLSATGGLCIGASSGAGLDQSIAEWFRVQAISNTNFQLKHTGTSWEFNAFGGIRSTNILTGDVGNAGLRCTPAAGGWDNWQDRNTALQVDLQGSSAANGLRFTLWGTTHVAAIQAAYTNSRGVMRLYSTSGPIYTIGQAGDGAHTFDGGGITVTAGNIKASNSLYAGAAAMGTDGNITGSIWGNNTIYAWLMANCMSTFGRGGQQYYQSTANSNWESPAGCVATGRNTNFNDGRQAGWYFRQMIGVKLNGSQFAIGDL